MEHVVDEEALVVVVNFDSNFVKSIADVVVVGCSCRPEMEHVVVEEALVAFVNCRCVMEIVVEAIVADAAANDCALVVLVVAFGNSKDLELEFVEVLEDNKEFEIEGFEEFE